ncbi:hypothetical protein ACFWMJ_02995 [Streptomyces hawaiiensis]|uniref:hypothetical protein n=1 Tax=Streptomyces hawaiiensis TaxID=67305 RepID=UPI00364847F6
MLAGLLLSAYYTGRATVADAWRILHFRLEPKARTWLDIPRQPPATARECIAASSRLYRGFDRITTALDPARWDRRSRLPQDIANAYADAWNVPSGRQAAERLQRLANELVLSPVRIAQSRGHLRGWRGDIGVDATPIPVLARHPSEQVRLVDHDRGASPFVDLRGQRRTPELTGKHLARFLLDPCEVSVEVTDYPAGRLEIADAGASTAGTGAGGRRRSPADGGAAADWGTAHWISSMCGWSGDTGQTCSCRS